MEVCIFISLNQSHCAINHRVKVTQVDEHLDSNSGTGGFLEPMVKIRPSLKE